MSGLKRRFAVLMASIGYWALLPASLLFLARKIDTLLSLPSVSGAVGLGIGIPLVSSALIGTCWCLVAFYLQGGGFPLAFHPPVRLVQEGPYAASRHPLYLSFTIYLIGLALLIRSIAALGIVIPGFTLIWICYALLHEEPVIARRYGTSYAEYKAEVPFFFHLRRGAPGPGAVFSLVYLLGKLIISLLFPMKVEGREHLPQVGPYIVLANHASYLDPVFLVAAGDRYVRFLTTAEMMRTRFSRWFFTCAGTMPTRRYRVDPGSVRALLTALKKGEIVGIFPEGERTWDGNPLPVDRTVERLLSSAGVPLVAARIEGSYAVYPRWSRYPLPGRITIRFFPSFPPERVGDALSRIAVPSGGRTILLRAARGLESLLWACPSCRAIGSIGTRGRSIHCDRCRASWTLDRRLRVIGKDGKTTSLAQLASSLNEEEVFAGVDSLEAIGSVDLLAGSERLSRLASGRLIYRDGRLHIGKEAFDLSGARIIKVEGRDRLDIGLPQEKRLRLVFTQDSPLKWEQFLLLKLKIKTLSESKRTKEADCRGRLR
ncbi:hypothetical protein DRJ12_04125 [Candidatus Acetothermia bacterium]|nr:MAG: hypothetical protein DRJ12_04125 [Candidatus Acetothermia bacterium]